MCPFQDRDGYITLKEFRAYHLKNNLDESAIAKAFAAIDSDNDGLVTYEGKIR
jgi:Ca2+-binding EF-hand superfamily protein